MKKSILALLIFCLFVSSKAETIDLEISDAKKYFLKNGNDYILHFKVPAGTFITIQQEKKNFVWSRGRQFNRTFDRLVDDSMKVTLLKYKHSKLCFPVVPIKEENSGKMETMIKVEFIKQSDPEWKNLFNRSHVSHIIRKKRDGKTEKENLNRRRYERERTPYLSKEELHAMLVANENRLKKRDEGKRKENEEITRVFLSVLKGELDIWV